MKSGSLHCRREHWLLDAELAESDEARHVVDGQLVRQIALLTVEIGSELYEWQMCIRCKAGPEEGVDSLSGCGSSSVLSPYTRPSLCSFSDHRPLKSEDAD